MTEIDGPTYRDPAPTEVECVVRLRQSSADAGTNNEGIAAPLYLNESSWIQVDETARFVDVVRCMARERAALDQMLSADAAKTVMVAYSAPAESGDRSIFLGSVWRQDYEGAALVY